MTALAIFTLALFGIAFAAVIAVFVGTLLPVVPRIVALLRGDWS